MLRDFYKVGAEIEESLETYNLQDQMLDLIIGIFGLTAKSFEEDSFHRLVSGFKERCDYAQMNTNMACLYSTLLTILFENPNPHVYPMMASVEVFRETGFRSRMSNMMGLVCIDASSNCEQTAARALAIYRAMHDHHNILTGEDDYLASVLLSFLDLTIDEMMEQIEAIYHRLHAFNFPRGNGLQALSHQLMLVDEDHRADLVENVGAWHQVFKHWHIKSNSSRLLIYGVLSDCDMPREAFIDHLEEKISHIIDKKLTSLEQTILILDAIKEYFPTYVQMSKERQAFIKGSLMLLINGYLFKEKLV